MLLKNAIANANQHIGVKDPLALQKAEEEKEEAYPENKKEWKTLSSEWESAMKGKGIITDSHNKLRLDIWRASTDLPGYITCVEGKREAIKRIWDKMIDFKINAVEASRSCSILLEADPGTGKTFLASKLAEELGFTSIQHDITQMVNREELLDLFDIIATAQADKKIKGLSFLSMKSMLLWMVAQSMEHFFHHWKQATTCVGARNLISSHASGYLLEREVKTKEKNKRRKNWKILCLVYL